MTTRLRDWVILAVVLAAVFGASLQAPRQGTVEDSSLVPVRAAGYSPVPGPDDYRPRPRLPRAEPPFFRIDPRPMILYTRPQLGR